MHVRTDSRITHCVLITMMLGALSASHAKAAILSITGSSSARVVLFGPDVPTESDFSENSVPGTVPTPPAVATARIDFFDDNGEISAGGTALSVFENPNLSGFGNPNDVGLDLSCFTDDDKATWLVQGTASESRVIVLDAPANTTGVPTIGPSTANSNLLISGVLVITSLNAERDLTGVEATFNISVTQRLANGDSMEVAAGSLVMAGGPMGTVEIQEATGVLAPVAPPVIDFSGLVATLPVVNAVIFAGTQIPYTYEFTPGEEFELELNVDAQVRNVPGGTGAAAIFGLPQLGFGDLLARVKNDDRGRELEAIIAQQVDTTGAAYVNNGPGLPFLFPFCGALGMEAGLMLLAVGGGMMIRRRRRVR